MWGAWTDYESITHFATKEDGEAWLEAEYGPDKKTWPGLFEIEPERPKSRKGEYVAWAAWPDSNYNEPPKQPMQKVQWVKAGEEDPAPWGPQAVQPFYGRSAKNQEEALKLAIAGCGRCPVYEEKYSSQTSSGKLPVWVRQGVTSLNDGWKTRTIKW